MIDVYSIMRNGSHHFDTVIYVLFCENDKFYVGQTINFQTRMKDHFKYKNQIQYLWYNKPLGLLFYLHSGLTWQHNFNPHDLEDYVTVLISEKYGAENVFGGFRHLKTANRRIKFVEDYDYIANKNTVNLINSRIDFELPELAEVKDNFINLYKPRKII
jgi:hypothetical protein